MERVPADQFGPEAPATLADRFDGVITRLDELRERPPVVVAAVVLAVVVLAAGWWWRQRPVETVEATIPLATAATTSDGTQASNGAVAPEAGATEASGAAAAETSTTAAHVIVHVAGAVVEPGVVRLDATDRIEDAVAAAGGARPDGDPHQLNLAAPVVDGMRVVVPPLGEAAPHPTGLAPAVGAAATVDDAAAPTVVDLNRASVAELESLPGIGPALAAAIIERRTVVGPFAAVEELVTVSGIGPATLARLDGRVVVS
ncbi:MAG: helix-hairpin-helix domain-containing protein [Actinomycetota bacterium]